MKSKIIGIMIIMFFSGAILGFFTGKLIQSQKMRERMQNMQYGGIQNQKRLISKHFISHLKLNKNQQQDLDKIITHLLKGKQSLIAQNRPKQIKLLKTFNSELNEILTPPQSKKFKNMCKKRELKLFGNKKPCDQAARRQRFQNMRSNNNCTSQ